jgi:hypothetical protein
MIAATIVSNILWFLVGNQILVIAFGAGIVSGLIAVFLRRH